MNNLSILLAEDEALIRMDIKEMLEAAGHFVCGETNNGSKAVELARKLSPDLAILDVKMPGLDGLETAKILNSMDIPVLILTAYSKPNFINRAEKVSAFGYLVKPVTERDLLPAVQIAYARWRELQSMQKELKETRDKLKGQKTIAHAQNILAAINNITEYEAHQQLVHWAMESRMSLVQMAAEIVKDNKDKV